MSDPVRRTIGASLRRPGVAALVSGALVAGLLVGLGSGARAESLNEAMAAAYQNNPRLSAQRAQLRATDEQIAQAYSNWRPTITGEISAGTSSTSSRFAGALRGSSDQHLNPRSYSLRLNQPIFRGGRSFAEFHQAMSSIRAERARLVRVEQEVLLDVVRVYMDVVRDMAIVDLRENNVRVLRRQLQATRDRFSVGEVTRTDVAQAQARLSRAEAQLVEAQSNLNSSRARYENVVGRAPGTLERPEDLVSLPDDPMIVEDVARRRNPAVIAAGFAERVAYYESRAVLAELFPQLSIQALLSRDIDQSSFTERSDNATVQATLTIPLYQAGSTTSRIRAARQTVMQRRDELAQARRDVEQNAIQAWETLLSARSQITAFQAEVRANRIALEGVRQEARAGLRTVLDVLDAEQEYLNAQVSLVGAQRDLVVATYEVYAAMGKMTVVNLELSVEAYDEREYFESIRYLPWGLGPSVGSSPDNN